MGVIKLLRIFIANVYLLLDLSDILCYLFTHLD